MSSTSQAYRNTIYVEQAEVLIHEHHAADQHTMRLAAPHCAAHAQPGSFIHLQCAPALPMRRPFSIMRADPDAGWIDILYKVVGAGTRVLATRQVGESLSLLGPIGRPFQAHPDRPRTLLIGGGVGIPPMVFLAERLRAADEAYHPFVIMGSEIPFPFKPRPSAILTPDLPPATVAAMPLLDDWGIVSRLASLQGFPGCFEGYVTDLARLWLASLSAQQRAEVEVFACGPQAMLRACAELAQEFELPCQVSLEEYMACAVGGCAGCIVRVQTPDGPAMKRVCVDGPVFPADVVFYPEQQAG